MIICKYNDKVTCMIVNSFPRNGKIHNRCLSCEYLDKNIQIDILSDAVVDIIENKKISGYPEAYEIALSNVINAKA